MGNGWRCVALAWVVVLGAAASGVTQTVRQVLVLQSYDRGNLTIDQFTGTLRVELDRLTGSSANVIQVVVGPTGFFGASEQAVVNYIRAIFADSGEPDLIVTVAGPAAVFARKYRQQLFPDTALLFGAVDQRYLGNAPFGIKEVAVSADNDFPRLVESILQLLPGTRQIFVVLGSGQIGKFWRLELEDQFRRFHDRLTFVWSDDLSLPEVLRRCASLPRDSAIFYLTFGTDAQGRAYADERVFAALHDTANAPVFGAQSPLLGHGIVGGELMDMDALGRNTAAVAVRLLNGAPPRSINVPLQLPNQTIFDGRELQRWGITESRLPAGSVVRYRNPSLWQEHKLTILGTAGALTVQALLIVGLLYERRARQRAETESKRNLTLAADANRRETMSVLSNSIAHELGQPLSSMMHNAMALQGMVATSCATPDTIGEILSDIGTQGVHATQIIDRHRTMLRSRQLDKKPIDLRAVITESLALVAHDMKAREVEAAVDQPLNPCVINGDPVLLQQVLVNLLINAMDAMAETPPPRRHVTIRTDVKPANVTISVRDRGKGVPADIEGTVFTPFVTTKTHGMGVGLTIAQTIIHAHGGTIDARNNVDGGATFAVTLRRDEVPEFVSTPAATA